MSFGGTMRVLWHMARGGKGSDHAERLESFYGPQAKDYDAFREKLLHGRAETIGAIPLQAGDRYAEFGGGTGRNLEFLGERIDSLEAVDIVDLCPSLLEVARERCSERGWDHVTCHEADVTTFTTDAPYNAILFSYSLSMIPDWWAAIDRAVELLAPGGHLAVVDFYVSRKHPAAGRKRHGAFTRAVWPTWFRRDGVHLREDLLPYLMRKLEVVELTESKGRLPLTPCSVPHLRFIGRKPE